ncbi:S8 family peptidase [Fusobacteria bacterium ZRK30]|nr:S8 family peptidase [Fusobacteria bacterium ZRK30]
MKKLPILSKGEKLVEPITKKFAPNNETFNLTVEEAKLERTREIEKIISEIECNSEKYDKEIIVSVRMGKHIAKSYKPTSFLPKTLGKIIGGRRYTSEIEGVSKLYFFRTTTEKLNNLKKTVNTITVPSQAWEKDIKRIEKIDFLSNKEKIDGFEKNWKIGTVEIVIHPTETAKTDVLKKIKRILEGKKYKIKEYKNGPIFISTQINKTLLNKILDYNFLRTIHPIGDVEIPTSIEVKEKKSILRNFPLYKPSVLVGVFDGGVKEDNPLFKGLVKNYDCVSTIEDSGSLEHGTGVCGAILYGNLDTTNKNIIDVSPKIGVESFRVFPPLDINDNDLYEVVDTIEETVENRKDIKVYNLSLGPCGPILQDDISRFTYALDTLSYEKDLIFCTAVGNDGEETFNRIQSPSDMVNGLGIGAYSYNDQGVKVRAPYSCIGEGREGAKVKPDLLAFGGCENNPFELISTDGTDINFSVGTSFAAPIVAGKIGRMMAESQEISPQLAKSLLILNSDNNGNIKPTLETGYGFLNKTEDDILNCSNNNEVIIVYNGEISPGSQAKLKIPYPETNHKGKVKITWSLSLATPVDGLDTDGYTKCCIVDTFYPHSEKFKFSKNKKNRIVNVNKDREKVEELISQGFKQSALPDTESGNLYKCERELRKHMKWDTTVKRHVSKLNKSLKDPFLVLHGMEREASESDKIKYALSVKVEFIKYAGNLYSEIRNQYKILSPLQLRTQLQTQIEV